MSSIPILKLESLQCVKDLDRIRRQFVYKLDNRKKLHNYLSVCKALGFDGFCQTCNPTPINREIVKELISDKL